MRGIDHIGVCRHCFKKAWKVPDFIWNSLQFMSYCCSLAMICIAAIFLAVGPWHLIQLSKCNAIHEQTGLPVQVSIGDGCRILQNGKWVATWEVDRIDKGSK